MRSVFLSMLWEDSPQPARLNRLARLIAVASVIVLAAACAPTAETDSDETAENLPALVEPEVAFDPANGVIPTPNTLGLLRFERDQSGAVVDQRLSVPESCGETQAQALIREGIINTLDGWPSNSPQPIRIPLTAPVDVASVTNSVFIFDGSTGEPIAFNAESGTTPVFNDQCEQVGEAPTLVLNIDGRLEESTSYSVAVVAGLRTVDGARYRASTTWSLVRQSISPIEIEADDNGQATGINAGTGERQSFNVIRNDTPFDPATEQGATSILGLDALWRFHNEPLVEGSIGLLPATEIGAAANGFPLSREDLLQVFVFTTQSASPALDPDVAGATTALGGDEPTLIAPLDLLNSDPTMPSTAPPSAPENLDRALCAARGEAPGCGLCDFDPEAAADGSDAVQLPCFATGKSLVVQFESPMYGPGAWSDPYRPEVMGNDTITALYFEPAGDSPEGGWPVAVFAHGLGASKETVFALVPSLNRVGLAVIAIDWPLHGTPGSPSAENPNGTNGRGIRNTMLETCQGEPAPAFRENPECYQPFLSADLTATRDSIRQGIVDVQALTDMLGVCGDGSCQNQDIPPELANTALNIDATRIGYLGQSLGGIIGTSVASLNPDIQAATLNVAGVDWITIFENSQTPAITCPLVTALLAQGVFTEVNEDDIACEPGNIDPTTWNTDPGYQRFTSVARWVLEIADGVTFAPRVLADDAPAVLIQEVDGDAVVDNRATAILVQRLGLSATPANIEPPGSDGILTPTLGVTGDDGMAAGERLLYIDYEQTPLKSYTHASLLTPALDGSGGPTLQGLLGTAQIQTDAIVFLRANLMDAPQGASEP